MPHVAEIQSAVCRHYHIPPIEMISQRRNACRPRQIAMYLSRELTPASLATIGRLFARDHTTVMHACKTIAALIEHDPRIADAVAVLRGRFSQPVP